MKGSKNGFDSEIFKQAVRLSIGDTTTAKVIIFDAKVQAGTQDSDTFTCYVDSIDSNINNLQVRYHLCTENGEINTPADNSIVTIASTQFTDPYIVKYTDLLKKELAIGKQEYINDGEKQEFNFYTSSEEGSFGGFVKILDPTTPSKGILARINKMENSWNDFVTKWNAFCSVYVPGSPSTIGLPATLATSTATQVLPITQKSDIENPNLLHGLKIDPNG